MNLLLVEDEPRVISLLQRSLADSGYQVSVAMDGKSALEMAFSHDFDLIILDLMLPGKSGMEVCNEYRKKNKQTPILMLTALSATPNIVSGLDSGADDYLTKPFKIAELEARIRTLIRRKSGEYRDTPPKLIYRIADLELSEETKTVKRKGKAITLTATEFRLLSFLLKNRNKVLSRTEILENVWDINFSLETNVVDVYVNYLRKKVDAGYSVKLIHTVFGMGYVLKEGDDDSE